MFDLGFEGEVGQVIHAHGIENAIEMVDFMLNHAGMQTFGLALDQLAIR